MSQYATPFLVLNLGSEMIFVIAQRLQAQNITQDRATLVLDEILSILISPTLIAELIKPQIPLSHDLVRCIIEDVTQSSIMRLDNHSMDRLWDLITMVFKWQVTLSPDLIGITLRHLYEIETYTINPKTQLQLHKVTNIVENFNKIFNENEKDLLRQDVLGWLKKYNIRVSLLLRMGLQNQDGSFVSNNTNPIAQEMLKNLGENIYAVTQNGRVMEPNEPNESNDGDAQFEESERSCELQGFVDQILGVRKLSSASSDNGMALKLMIDSEQEKENEINVELFDNIEVSTQGDKLQKIFDDLNLDNVEAQSSIKDDLLAIIGNESD